MLIGCKPELRRDPVHAVIADEAEMFLPKMQQRHGGAAFAIGRIARDRFVHFPLQLGGNVRARRVHRKAIADNVLSFDCTLSSLKTIVTVSLSLSVNVGRFLQYDEIRRVDRGGRAENRFHLFLRHSFGDFVDVGFREAVPLHPDSRRSSQRGRGDSAW